MSTQVFRGHPQDTTDRELALHSFARTIVSLHQADKSLAIAARPFMEALIVHSDVPHESRIANAVRGLKGLSSEVGVPEFETARMNGYECCASVSNFMVPNTAEKFHTDRDLLYNSIVALSASLLQERKTLKPAHPRENVSKRMLAADDELVSTRLATFLPLQSALWALAGADDNVASAVEPLLLKLNQVSKQCKSEWHPSTEAIEQFQQLVSSLIPPDTEASDALAGLISSYRGLFDADTAYTSAKMTSVNGLVGEKYPVISQAINTVISNTGMQSPLATVLSTDVSQQRAALDTVHPSDAILTVRQSAQDHFKRNIYDILQASGASENLSAHMLSYLQQATMGAPGNQIALGISSMDELAKSGNADYREALSAHIRGLERTFDMSQPYGPEQFLPDMQSANASMFPLLSFAAQSGSVATSSG